MTLREIQEQRGNIVQEMRGLLATAEQEKRDLTEAESKKFDELKGQEKNLQAKEERAKTVAELERSMESRESRGTAGEFETACKKFSLLRAIGSVLTNGQVDAGREFEVSQELSKRAGKQPQGIWVPHEVFQEKRTMIATSGSGAHLIPEMHRADLFVDVLREALAVKRAGATVLDGLVGEIDIPRQTTASTAYWIDEATDVTESTPVYDTVSLSPTTVAAQNNYSRRMLISGNPSVERLFRNDLAKTIAGAIDNQALNGTGSSNLPTGVLNTGSVNTVSFGGAPTWAKVVEMIAEVAIDNALMGSLAFMANAHTAKELRSTLVTGTYGDRMIMENPNQLAGYPFVGSNYLDGDPDSSPAEDGTMIFANWSDLLLGYWTGVDIVVNPYETNVYKKGAVLVAAFQDLDVTVRHAASFCKATDITLS